ncbi:hypothetical protein MMC07_009418 [Pseudocyphellaria aurata]|nr:hypothetical protein [Pseudocyphellaria aurata]
MLGLSQVLRREWSRKLSSFSCLQAAGNLSPPAAHRQSWWKQLLFSHGLLIARANGSTTVIDTLANENLDQPIVTGALVAEQPLEHQRRSPEHLSPNSNGTPAAALA